jgi:hypothetical protein
VQVDIAAQNCGGSNTTLSVYKVENNNTRLLQSSPVAINSNDFFVTRELILDATPSGVQRFRISLGQLSGEATAANNSKEIFIDVLDARQKILILANAPHPDITALKQSLSTNKNYQITTANIGQFTEDAGKYDLIVMHQLPSQRNDATAVLNTIKARKIPTFFIVGAQTNLSRLSEVQSLINIRSSGPSSNDVQAKAVAGIQPVYPR